MAVLGMCRIFPAVILIVAARIVSVSSISVDVPPGTQQCMGLEVVAGTSIQASYKVHDVSSATERTHTTFSITRPSGTIEYSTSNQPEINYPFDATDDGTYRLCLRNTGGDVRRVSFTFEKGQSVGSPNEIAKKKDLEPVESELYQIELETDEIFREMHTARDREESFRELNDGISDKVMMYSVLSMLVMLASAAWQVFHLKSFFHHIKIL